jgi:DNA-binding beta-propeller fold protein YncE
LVQEISLPGPANRFDYQNLDPSNGHLYMSHMNAGTMLVFDVNAAKLLSEVPGLSRATGVWGVPSHHAVYVSSAGLHQAAVLDDRTFQVIAHVDGIRFPDGIAYAPAEDRVFVSDESGEADVVIDAKTNTRVTAIALGGEAGNTHYDSVSHCILVAVQTRNQLAAIDPATAVIIQRYDLPGSNEPHGFVLDEPGRLAFISSQGSALLQVVDLRTMRVVGSAPVGESPDVLAWDAAWRRLYVATEGGVLNAFAVDGATLHALPVYEAPHAHTVAVDPRSHRVYLPLENIQGKPVLRILTP